MYMPYIDNYVTQGNQTKGSGTRGPKFLMSPILYHTLYTVSLIVFALFHTYILVKSMYVVTLYILIGMFEALQN